MNTNPTTDPLGKLLFAYGTAARMKPDPTVDYNSMVQDLHGDIQSIMSGADAAGVVANRVRVWRDDARLAGSEAVAARLDVWADFLEAE